MLYKHSSVFADELGTAKGVTVTLHVDPAVQPKFYKARPVPFAIRPKVEDELDRLLTAGVIEPVQYSDWAAPVVPVAKQDGSIGLCGNYKLTVNKAA